MAKVEIDTPGVTIRIDDEPGGPELDARALALYRAAVATDVTQPTGPAAGVQAERRGIADHRDPNGRSSFGFAPIKAGGD